MNSLWKVMIVLTPIPVMLLIGWTLRVTGTIGHSFIREGNKVVYYVCLPALIVLKFISLERSFDFDPIFLNLFLAFTLFNFFVAVAMFRLFDFSQDKKIPFLVGSFRGNLVIFGLAVLETLVSGAALTNVLFSIGASMVLYNLLTALVYPRHESAFAGLVAFLLNPLIVSMLIGATFVVAGIDLPKVAVSCLTYCAEITFPLAFIILGATLKVSRKFKLDLWCLVILKTFLAPLLFTILAKHVFDFDHSHLVAFFVLCASPVAVITVAISSVTKSDELFATEAVTLSTALAFLIVSVGISFL